MTKQNDNRKRNGSSKPELLRKSSPIPPSDNRERQIRYLERTLRRPCRQVELHHVPTGEVLAWEHDDASLREHVRRAEETAAELDAARAALAAGGAPEELFPPRPAPRCGTCDVRRNCPEGRAAVPEQPAWALLAP